jgi:hypothetical protein
MSNTITITLPADLSADMIKKVASYRKALAQQNARRNNGVVTIDPKTSDEEFLVADITDKIFADYRDVVKGEAMRDAGKTALAELDKKLFGAPAKKETPLDLTKKR